MKHPVRLLLVILLITVLVVIGAPAAMAGSPSLPLGMNDLTPALNAPMWQHLFPGTASACMPKNFPPGSSATDVWHYGHDVGSGVCNYDTPGTKNSGILFSPAFTASGQVSPVVRFWYMIQTESGTNYDLAKMYVSVDGGNFSDSVNPIVKSSETMGTWQLAQTTLAQCAGHTCQIMFSFDTVDSWYNTTPGFDIAGFMVTDDAARLVVQGSGMPSTLVPGMTFTMNFNVANTGKLTAESPTITTDWWTMDGGGVGAPSKKPANAVSGAKVTKVTGATAKSSSNGQMVIYLANLVSEESVGYSMTFSIDGGAKDGQFFYVGAYATTSTPQSDYSGNYWQAHARISTAELGVGLQGKTSAVSCELVTTVVTVRNTGGLTAAGTKLTLKLESDGPVTLGCPSATKATSNIIPLGSSVYEMGNVESGASRQVTFSYAFQVSKPTTVILNAAVGTVTMESDYANNNTTGKMTISPPVLNIYLPLIGK